MLPKLAAEEFNCSERREDLQRENKHWPPDQCGAVGRRQPVITSSRSLLAAAALSTRCPGSSDQLISKLLGLPEGTRQRLPNASRRSVPQTPTASVGVRCERGASCAVGRPQQSEEEELLSG